MISHRSVICTVLGLLAAANPGPAAEVSVELVGGTAFAAGQPVNGNTHVRARSADGRYLLLETEANNLVPGIVDANTRNDLYVLDRESGEYDLVARSFAHPERSGRGESWAGAISDDGRWVAFQSAARDLIAGGVYPPALPFEDQVYLFDRSSRVTRLVSHAWDGSLTAGDSAAYLAGLSGDGRFISFTSGSTNLAPGLSGAGNVFVYDRESQQNVLASHRHGAPGMDADGDSFGGEMTPDGRFLLIASRARNLVAGQLDDHPFSVDVFVYDRVADLFELITRSAADPLRAIGGSPRGLSDDGRYVLIESEADGLVPFFADGNGAAAADCFLADRQAGKTMLVSHAAGQAARGGDGVSVCHRPSPDGRVVFFSSASSDLAANFADRNGAATDAYVFDRQSGAVTLASHRAGSAAAGGDGASYFLDYSSSFLPDGRAGVLASEATDLVEGQLDEAGPDFFLYDRAAGQSTLISRYGSSQVSGLPASHRSVVIDPGGAAVFFSSTRPLDGAAPNRAPYLSQAYRFDVAASRVELLVKTGMAGISTQPPLPAEGDGAWLSGNGRWVVFGAYLWEVGSAAYRLVGHRAGAPLVPANQPISAGRVSDDGAFALYHSEATDLAPGIDDNGRDDVFLYDRAAAAARLISHRFAEPARAAAGRSRAGWLSGDGAEVLFDSDAADLVDGFSSSGVHRNLYAYDRRSGAATLISHGHRSPLEGAAANVDLVAVADNGRDLLLASSAGNLVPNFLDWSLDADLYHYDRAAGRHTLVAHRPGLPGASSTSVPVGARITADGSAVFYQAAGDDLVPGQVAQPGTFKIYRWNRATNTNELVLHAAGDPARPCAGSVFLGDISPDGRWVLLWGTCRLVPGDDNDTQDVYLFDRQSAQAVLITHRPGEPSASLGVDGVRAADLSRDARRAIYVREAAPFSYDLASRAAVALAPAYYDPEEHPEAYRLMADDAGMRVLFPSPEGGFVPFDAGTRTDFFLSRLNRLFGDGFESASTGWWSQTVP